MRLNTPAPLPALAAAAAVCAAVAGLPGQAVAQSSPLARPALTTKSVHLRAGPSRDYPAIAVLPRGTAVWVEGCLRDISWCDVAAGTERGWIYALNLSFEVQGALVPVPRWAPEIGIGIIGFLLGSYWAEHYRDRPWYAERDRWHRPPHALPAPPASPRPRPPHQPPPARPHPPGLAHPPGRMPPPAPDHPPGARPPRAEAPARPAPPPRVAPPPAHSSPPTGSPGPPPAGPPRPSRPPDHPPGRGPDARDEPHRRTGPPGRPATP